MLRAKVYRAAKSTLRVFLPFYEQPLGILTRNFTRLFVYMHKTLPNGMSSSNLI